jgi:hypothetical protein
MAKGRVTLTINDLWSLIIVEDNVGEIRTSIKDDTRLEDTVDLDSRAMQWLKAWVNNEVLREGDVS